MEMNNETVKNEVHPESAAGTAEENSSAEMYLTFVSNQLTFGVPTDYVVEIITNHSIRELPLVPDYVRGIINLRGQIIPIIDIRLKLNKPIAEFSSTTCVIILDIGADRIGICVDSVSNVRPIDAKQARQVPLESRQKIAPSMVSVGDGKVVLMLDCAALVES